MNLELLEQRLRSRQDPARVRYTTNLVNAKADESDHQLEQARLNARLVRCDDSEHRASLALIACLIVGALMVAHSTALVVPCAIMLLITAFVWRAAHADANAARQAMSKARRYCLGDD